MFRQISCMLIVSFASLLSVNSLMAVESFRLPDINNEPVEIAAGEQLTVVCFLGTECPLAKLYAPRLNQLAKDFGSVRFVAVNSNRQDSLDEVRAYSTSHDLSFPMLKDFRNEVADQFEAKRTPEVFVLDQEFNVRYRGRIDDQYEPGVSRQAPKQQELRTALEQLVAGTEPTISQTEPVGCLIGRVREPVTGGDVTYSRDVARVLKQHCVECHRDGEIGPFRLDDYEEVVGWADTMVEVIDDGRMPPWHANPDFGAFKNTRHMPEEAKETLRKWVNAGMPYGDADDLPEPLPKTEGWRLSREPDLVVEMSKRKFTVPADGTVEYQYFVVDPGFEDDKWISGAQVIPGNPRVVHHSIVFVRPPDGSEFRGIGWLTAYVPGTRAGEFPKGHAIKIPAKSKLVFQQHYTPTGTTQTDVTKLGITFADDEDVSHEVYTVVGIDQQFEIPPGEANHVVKSEVRYLPQHATLRSIMPHMHLRGKSFRCVAETDDKKEVVLDVPNYDFNWQHAYQLKEPIPFSKLDRLRFDVAFDNSSKNPVNPNPDEYVTWGDQTWEEMAVAFFEVSEPRVKPSDNDEPNDAEVATQQEPVIQKTEKQLSAEQVARIESKVDRLMELYDNDKDGVIKFEDTSIAFRQFVFHRLDGDGNRTLSRDEIEKATRDQMENWR